MNSAIPPRQNGNGPVYSWAYLRNMLPMRVQAPPVWIDFVRHGESRGNAAGLISGSWDVELSPLGKKQASQLGSLLSSRYKLCWASALTRSQDTLVRALSYGSTPRWYSFCIDQRLNERSLGVLEKQVCRHIPEYDAGDLAFAPPGGESYLELTQRILSFLLDLAEVSSAIPRPTRLLVSTHMGPLRVIAGLLEKTADPRQVLRRKFGNAEPYSARIERIEWPTFLSKLDCSSLQEITNDRSSARELPA
jgi:broad specificity phosphatase PhoE